MSYTHRFLVATVLASIFTLALPSAARAHADLHERIERATERIRAEPGNPTNYLHRAALFRLHEEYDNALADIASAERCEPALPGIELARAETLYDAGKPSQALIVIDLFLKNQPDHAQARVLRARCLTNLGRTSEALSDYDRALRAFSSPPPDIYLERARAQAALGRLDDAVAGLDQGMKRLGPVPGLELAAIEYVRQSGNFDAAIARAAAMTGRNAVKEPGLALQAQLLEAAGRLKEARETYLAVVRGVESYPPSRRGTAAARDLESSARSGAARIETRLVAAAQRPTPNDTPSSQ